MANQTLVKQPGAVSSGASAGTIRTLQKELLLLNKEPIEGFTVEPDSKDILKWRVGIFGPPETIYQGGYFKAQLNFPSDYPFAPPSLRFTTAMWHPNIYKNGDVCISILHPPGEDEQSGEHASERWLPTQGVRTVLMSVISLLNEPNISSPANVDASVAYRKWKAGEEDAYEKRVKELVAQSREQAQQEGISVPESVEAYCVKHPKEEESCDLDDTFSDAASIDNDDDDEEEEEEEEEDDCGDETD